MNVVANNFFGLESKPLICFSFFLSTSEISFSVCEFKEKKDMSDPETRADNNINKKTTIKLIKVTEFRSWISNDIIVVNKLGKGSAGKII